VGILYDTLYEYKYLKRPYEVKPNLAESLPKISKDNLTYTIKLKKGVYFIDDSVFPGGKGREVTAADFVYSLKRHFDPKMLPTGTGYWEKRIVGLDEWKDAGSKYEKEVAGLKSLDRYTVQVTLKEPYPQFIYTLAMPFASVVPKEAVDKYGKEFKVHPVGSGPFILKEFSTKKAELIKNPNYHDMRIDLEGYSESVHGTSGIKALSGLRIPLIDRLIISFMEEDNAWWNSFNKGTEVQIVRLPHQQVPNVVEPGKPFRLKPAFASKYTGRLIPEFGFTYYVFNMDDPEVGYNKDPKRNQMNQELRCAVREAYDWRTRIDRFHNGVGDPYPGIIPPLTDGFDEKISRNSVTRNVESAKARLAKAGWTAENLPNLDYHTIAKLEEKQMFELFRGLVVEIGYPTNKIKMKAYPTFGDFSKALNMRKARFLRAAWGLDFPDSENALQLFYGPNGAPGANVSNYNNPEYNALFKKAAVMFPSSERTKIYKKLNQMVIDDCVAISAYSRPYVWIWQKDVLLYHEDNILRNYVKYAGLKE
jgi:ABC-type transport system substrate-binding protein